MPTPSSLRCHVLYSIPKRCGAVGGRQVVVEQRHMRHGGDGGRCGGDSDGAILVFAALEGVRRVQVHRRQACGQAVRSSLCSWMYVTNVARHEYLHMLEDSNFVKFD